MPTLQIRELPGPIYEKLSQQAREEHRSLSQQAVVVLARGLGFGEKSKQRRRQLLQALTASPLITGGDDLTDPVTLIREDRDR